MLVLPGFAHTSQVGYSRIICMLKIYFRIVLSYSWVTPWESRDGSEKSNYSKCDKCNKGELTFRVSPKNQYVLFLLLINFMSGGAIASGPELKSL